VNLGLLVLHVVVGLVMIPHGAQKLFGWFGGGGPRGTAGFFGSSYRFPLQMAVLAGCCEFFGGLGLATGFLTPFAALAVAIVMINAIIVVHWKNGFFAGAGGYEFNLLILGVVVALAGTSPGRFSLDDAAGWADNLSGKWWVIAVAGAAAAIAATTLALFRKPVEPVAAEAPAS
jgi:putative oxidoreductase